MTDMQQRLIGTLAARKVTAEFNGRFLNGHITYTLANGKKQRQSFGIVFDDAAALEGPRVTSNLRGKYAHAIATQAFFDALQIGGGDEEAVEFVNECRQSGAYNGAPQSWLDKHDSELIAV